MSTTKGIVTLLIETHNWGKTAAFWKSLGYVIDFETDHNSGQLHHPAGGPNLFIAERAPDQPLKIVAGLTVSDAASFTPPPSGTVISEFSKQHWGGLQMLLADPDGRDVAIDVEAR